MRISSINFQKSNPQALHHNDRTEQEADYLLPPPYRQPNCYDRSAVEAKKLLKKWQKEAEKNHRKKYKQKLQARVNIWEAVVNLEQYHQLDDVRKLADMISKITGFRLLQIAIHRDEGHVDKNRHGEDEIIHNYHAHIVFFTLDGSTGQQLYRRDVSASTRKNYLMKAKSLIAPNRLQASRKRVCKMKQEPKWEPEEILIKRHIQELIKQDGIVLMNRETLSFLQTITADILMMPRGGVSIKTEAKRINKPVTTAKVRQEHKQYKQTKRQEAALEIAYTNDRKQLLKAHQQTIDALNSKTQEMISLQAQYDKLEQAYNDPNYVRIAQDDYQQMLYEHDQWLDYEQQIVQMIDAHKQYNKLSYDQENDEVRMIEYDLFEKIELLIKDSIRHASLLETQKVEPSDKLEEDVSMCNDVMEPFEDELDDSIGNPL